jgi:hypothetical protein
MMGTCMVVWGFVVPTRNTALRQPASPSLARRRWDSDEVEHVVGEDAADLAQSPYTPHLALPSGFCQRNR